MNSTKRSMLQNLRQWLYGVRHDDPQTVLDNFQCFYELDLGDGLKTTDSLQKDHPGHVEFTNAKFACVMQMVDEEYPDGLKGKSCLDIACNCGVYSFALAERSMDRGLGFDSTTLWIQLAHYLQHLKGKKDSRMAAIDFRIGDFYSVSFPEEMFDVTLCLGFLYHTNDVLAACQRLSDWTGETLIIQTRVIADEGPVARLSDPETQEFIDDDEFSIVPSKDMVIACMKRAGFHTVKEWLPADGNDEAGIFLSDPTNLFLIARKNHKKFTYLD